MNLKFIVSSALLLTTVIHYQITAVTRITSDAQFREIISSRTAVIGVGLQANTIGLTMLCDQLGQVQGNFNSAGFYCAFEEDIPYSAAQYSLGFGAAVFKGGQCIGQVSAPTDTNTLISNLKRLLGSRPLAGN